MSNAADRFVKLYPKIIDDKIFKDPRALQIFIYCICKARVKGNEFLDSGSFIIKQNEMAKEIGTSPKTTQRFMKFLKDNGYIDYYSTKKGTYIKVINFNKYNPYKDKTQ